MGLFDFIGNIFKPAANLVDELHVSDEERFKLRNELAKIQGEVDKKFMDLQKTAIDAQSKVQVAEAGSKYWLTATWRPITCLSLVGLILAESFGIIPPLSDNVYMLTNIMFGSYSVGRSYEKAKRIAKGL